MPSFSVPPPKPGQPATRPVTEALGASPTLQSLLHRLRESQQRWAVASTVLPEALRQQVQPGPLDDQGWTLLAANSAVAAKLRQTLPMLESALLAGGWKATPIRVHLQGRS